MERCWADSVDCGGRTRLFREFRSIISNQQPFVALAIGSLPVIAGSFASFGGNFPWLMMHSSRGSAYCNEVQFTIHTTSSTYVKIDEGPPRTHPLSECSLPRPSLCLQLQRSVLSSFLLLWATGIIIVHPSHIMCSTCVGTIH